MRAITALRGLLLGLLFTTGAVIAAEPGFTATLGADVKARLGLATLTPAQLAGLDAAVDDYIRRRPAPPAAKVEAKPSAGPPGRSFVRIAGKFRGWSGGTYFPLQNGQIWRQVGTDLHEMPPVENAEVEIFQSANGYYRLKYAGAWITVKRLQ